MNFSVRQPVILFGYPTNGYLSLNNSMYRLQQFAEEGRSMQYYNRYYVELSQPFFQPNALKNNLEEAEINLQQEKLDFQDNVVDIIDDISDDYFDLFELAYERVIQRRRTSDLKTAVEIAEQGARAGIDSVASQRLKVELGNAREQVKQLESEFRLQASQMRQQLRLAESDSLHVEPELDVKPLSVSVDQAVEYGYSLRPRLRRLKLNRRENELALANSKGWNSFRAELEATYGLEMRNQDVGSLWNQPENSYSVGVNISIPIWDWGRRESRIQARQIGLKKARLRIEEARRDIRNNISNAVRSLNEYQDRALTMQQNLDMAANVSETSLKRFESGEISALELIQTLNSQTDTAQNLLDAYLGYEQAQLDLLEFTYYDFESQEPIFRRFDLGRYGPSPETVKDALQQAEAVSDSRPFEEAR
jgi:outer membrane protein TolC